MHFVGILVIFSTLILNKTSNAAPDAPLKKLVICPALPQFYLDDIGNDFKIEEAPWNLCDTVIVVDKESKGKWFSIVRSFFYRDFYRRPTSWNKISPLFNIDDVIMSSGFNNMFWLCLSTFLGIKFQMKLKPETSNKWSVFETDIRIWK